MQTSGKDFERALAQAVQRLAAAAEAQRREQGADRSRLEALLTQRSTLLERLARHYLPSLTPEAPGLQSAGLRERLERLWTQREARRLELAEALAAAEAERQRREGDLARVTEALEALVRRREDLETELAARLAKDEAFRALSESAAQAEQALSRHEARQAELAEEVREKLPAYDRDALFQYLVRRSFGSADYRSRGLVRRLDRWVARLTRFEKQRRSYDFLRSAPELVAAEIERRQADFEALMEQVEDRRDGLEAELGLDAVRAEGERLGAERDRLTLALSATAQEEAARRAERGDLEQHRCRFYAEALAAVKGELGQTATGALAERARATPDPRDDALVIEIEAAAREGAVLEAEVAADLERLRRSEGRATELQALLQRYRLQNFDAARSVFLAGAPLAELARCETGELAADELWRQIEARQSFRPPPLPALGGSAGGTPGRPGAPLGSPAGSGHIPGGWVPGQASAAGGRRAPDALPASASPVADLVIDLVGLALRHSMARSIGRRGRGGGWGIDLGFPGQLGLPSQTRSNRSSSRSSGPSRSSAPKSRPAGRGGFSTREGF
jgi:hypothetical protein